MSALTAAGPVLVHFFDFAQLNSFRALPYVREWHSRYAPLGLSTLGIHSPRFGFTADDGVATDGVIRLEVEHPVALDTDYSIWHDYGCLGWPSLFLWGQGGALRWAHRGEGEYQATEVAIQEELRANDATVALPELMEAVRPTDVEGALLPPPSAEIFPGGSPAEPTQGGATVETEFEAGEAWVVADGEGEMRVSVDGAAPTTIAVPPAGLAKLTGDGHHEGHSLGIESDDGVRVWAISFAPGTQ